MKRFVTLFAITLVGTLLGLMAPPLMVRDVKADPQQPAPQAAPEAKHRPRGAKKSPRHKLQSATPHRIVKDAPPQFAVVPKKLSMWLNDQYGDCVTAQEAFAKAVWSVQCGLPELFVPDAEVQRWAGKYGFLNGADLTSVMDKMQKDGLNVDGVNYKDGAYSGVDYSNEKILQNAIFTGPVNIAIDANALPQGAGSQSGWCATGGSVGQYPNTDHCVAICGYGPAAYLYQQLGVPQPPEAKGDGYLLFTWSTIGFVDHAWLMSTCAEAWVRNPTTPGQTPAPTPSPTPSPAPNPTPTPTPNPAPTPAPVGDIVVTIPAGTLPGSYTVGGLNSDVANAIQSHLDEIAKLLKTQSDVGLPPPGWLHDQRVAEQIGLAMQRQGTDASHSYSRVAGDKQAHAVLLRQLHRRMALDPEGRHLLAGYTSGALPQGWLLNLLNWFVTNGPAILNFVQMILKMFGL